MGLQGFQLGKYIRGFGKAPAGADNNVLFSVFQATDKPCMITHLSTWGGDASETATFYLIPPEFVGQASNGQVSPAAVGGDEKNAMAIFGAVEGGTYTSTTKFAVFGPILRSTQYLLIPPNHGVSMAMSASPSTGFKVVTGAFELE